MSENIESLKDDELIQIKEEEFCIDSARLVVDTKVSWFYCTYPQCHHLCKGEWALGSHFEQHCSATPFVCSWPNCGQAFGKIMALKIHENKMHEVNIEDVDIQSEVVEYETLLNLKFESSKMLLRNLQNRLVRLRTRREFEVKECATALHQALTILRSKGVTDLPVDVEDALKKIMKTRRIKL